jgi:hypothetical protein
MIFLCINTFAYQKINQYSTGLFVSCSQKNPIAQKYVVSIFFLNRCSYQHHRECGTIPSRRLSTSRCQCYKSFFLCKLGTSRISESVCPWQAFPPYSNVCGWGQEPTPEGKTIKVPWVRTSLHKWMALLIYRLDSLSLEHYSKPKMFFVDKHSSLFWKIRIDWVAKLLAEGVGYVKCV